MSSVMFHGLCCAQAQSTKLWEFQLRYGAVFLGCVAICTSAIAQTTPTPSLVDEYLKASRTQETITAQADGYLQQLGVGVPAEAKAQYSKYVNATMGWDALKEQYASIIGRTYTAEELRAAIAFFKTPAGRSMAQKNITFSEQLSSASARNAQALTASASQTFSRDQSGDEGDAGAKDLSVREIEKHDEAGHTYFTGTLDNAGKRPARGVQVEVNLFSGKRFVDQYSTYISGTVPAGTSRYFKVSCGCKDNAPAPHDSFKVQVVAGY
jgi:hypothetical protein